MSRHPHFHRDIEQLTQAARSEHLSPLERQAVLTARRLVELAEAEQVHLDREPVLTTLITLALGRPYLIPCV